MKHTIIRIINDQTKYRSNFTFYLQVTIEMNKEIKIYLQLLRAKYLRVIK